MWTQLRGGFGLEKTLALMFHHKNVSRTPPYQECVFRVPQRNTRLIPNTKKKKNKKKQKKQKKKTGLDEEAAPPPTCAFSGVTPPTAEVRSGNTLCSAKALVSCVAEMRDVFQWEYHMKTSSCWSRFYLFLVQHQNVFERAIYLWSVPLRQNKFKFICTN